jgi:hypothetical protein
MQSMQSVPLTTYVLTSILVQGEMYFDTTLCKLIKIVDGKGDIWKP